MSSPDAVRFAKELSGTAADQEAGGYGDEERDDRRGGRRPCEEHGNSEEYENRASLFVERRGRCDREDQIVRRAQEAQHEIDTVEVCACAEDRDDVHGE
jgi:hypothetical protein